MTAPKCGSFPSAWRNRQGNLILDRRKASQIGPDCLQIIIRSLFVVRPGHRRQGISPVGLAVMFPRTHRLNKVLIAPFANTGGLVRRQIGTETNTPRRPAQAASIGVVSAKALRSCMSPAVQVGYGRFSGWPESKRVGSGTGTPPGP